MAKEKATNKKQALGKGIKALLNNIDDELKSNNALTSLATDKSLNQMIGQIDIDAIKINPKQPRKHFDKESLQALADSIQMHGIIQPITVSRLADGTYQLISGERRFKASKLAGIKTIPAFIRHVSDNQELLELALLENLQREDLNAIEIALSYQQLMDECQLTQEQVSDRMHKPRSTVANYIRLLKLPPDIQKAVKDNSISMGHARAILGLNKVDEQLYVFRECIQKNLSVRQTEALVKNFTIEKQQPQKEKKTNKLPPAYKRIEDDMASHFSTKVTMARKKNGKGTILIEFFSDEDLERIMSAMNL